MNVELWLLNVAEVFRKPSAREMNYLTQKPMNKLSPLTY